MQVPFFIAGPGIEANQQVNMPIYLQDAMATTLDLAKISKPDYVQFKSVMPLIEGSEKAQYPLVYGKYTHTQRMVQDGDFKLIVYPTIKVSRLYNTAKDPLEIKDLAKNPEYAAKIQELTVKLKKLMKDMGDDMDLDNPKIPKKNKKKKSKKK
jgi:choline-sulfatase